MVKIKSHAHDKTVTHFIPILIPAAGKKPHSVALFFQDRDSTVIRAVREFTHADAPASTSKRFSAIAKLLSLASGKKIDYSLLQESFRTLLEDVSGRPLADAVSKEALRNPRKAAGRWLVPLFNQEIQSARLVMWDLRDGRAIPAIFCADPEKALFVDLLFNGITACLGCGKLFTPHRPNQLYHDFLCANRHRKRRERRRRK